jgi:hypothetical protein
MRKTVLLLSLFALGGSAMADVETKFSGFVQSQFLSLSGREFKTNTGRTKNFSDFEVNRAQLRLDAQLTDKASAVFSVNAGSSEFARYSQGTNNAGDWMQLYDANVRYQFNEQIAIVGGQQKVPFSTEILTSSADRLAPERAHINTGLIGYEVRDIGLLLQFQNGPTDQQPWMLDLGVFNGTGINRADNNEEKDFLISVAKEQGPFGFRVSYITGKFGTGSYPYTTNRERNRISVDFHYNAANWGFEGQWADGDGAYYFSPGAGAFVVDDAKVKGGYAQVHFGAYEGKSRFFFRYQYYNANASTYRERINGYMFGYTHDCDENLRILAAYEQNDDKYISGKTDVITVRLQGRWR